MIKIEIKDVQLVPVGNVKRNPKNRNKHPKEQIEELARHYEVHGMRTPIIVSNRSGLIVAGDGRFQAALAAGMTEVPVTYQDFETPEKEFAFGVADNGLSLWSELDMVGIQEDIKSLPADFNLDDLGLKDFSIGEDGLGDGSGLGADQLEEFYTKKIKAPIYEPKGEKPAINELYDQTKANKLYEEIEKSEVPEEIKTFLHAAAVRHTVFNYEKIAEFYAHASEDVQELMENSALVIIDFKKAIEHGFVVLSKEIAEAYTDVEE